MDIHYVITAYIDTYHKVHFFMAVEITKNKKSVVQSEKQNFISVSNKTCEQSASLIC